MFNTKPVSVVEGSVALGLAANLLEILVTKGLIDGGEYRKIIEAARDAAGGPREESATLIERHFPRYFVKPKGA